MYLVKVHLNKEIKACLFVNLALLASENLQTVENYSSMGTTTTASLVATLFKHPTLVKFAVKPYKSKQCLADFKISELIVRIQLFSSQQSKAAI